MFACSQLPDEIWSIIGGKLDLAADRFRFRSVCKSWRSLLLPFPQPPWLMLAESEVVEPENKGEEEVNIVNSPPPHRGFVGIGEQEVYELDLPEAHQTRYVGSTGNWLITVGLDTIIRLLNPFTRVQIDLPSQSTFEYGSAIMSDGVEMAPEHYRDNFVRKVIVSSTPSPSNSTGKDCIAMAIHHYWKKLAIARPGDPSWITVQTPKNFIEDIIFYKEQFFAVNYNGVVMVCDIGAFPKASVLTEPFQKGSLSEKKYLVESLGELLLVIKFVEDLYEGGGDDEYKEAKKKGLPLYKTENFKVYKLDFTSKKWNEVSNLGDYCLFLGFNTSVSLLALNHPGSLKKNSIYFTDDYTLGYRGNGVAGGLDMGVFDLEDKSIRPHYKGISTSFFSPPLWIVPTPLAKVN